MSPSISVFTRRLRRHDEGFTMVEVIVALMIFGVIAAAVVPLLGSAARLATLAKLSTQAKQLSVERVEAMRNLPFYVAFDNGLYRDVLDIYFRDLQATGALEAGDPCSARSYLAASRTYRCTIAALTDYPSFSQQVDVQFLDANRVVLTPRTTYNARVTNQDNPQSGLLGVTVTTTWDAPGGAKSSVVRTEIANVTPATQQIVSEVGATAVKVSTAMSTGEVVQLEAGIVNADGALSTAASAAHNVVGAQANYLSGAVAQGASVTASAPPDETAVATTSGAQALGTSCLPICFGNTAVSGDLTAKVSSGLPLVSNSTSPATADLLRGGVSAYGGVSMSNASVGEQDPTLQLSNSKPMVSWTGGGSSSTVMARGTGYLSATKNPNAVRARATAEAETLHLLPTSFAPDGVVTVRLNSASLDCNNAAAAGTVSASWSATVSWYSNGSYVSQTVVPGGTALPDPSTITVLPGLPLSTWVDSWSGLTDASSTVESTGRLARGTLKAAVSITTKPTRGALDPSSALGVEVGSLTCTAEDNR